MMGDPGDPELQRLLHQARTLPGEPRLADPTFMKNEDGEVLVYPSVALLVIGNAVLQSIVSGVTASVLPGVFAGFNTLFREQRMAFTHLDVVNFLAACPLDEPPEVQRACVISGLRAIFPNAVFEDEQPVQDASKTAQVEG